MWSYTPRRVHAFMIFANKRVKAEHANAFAIARLAAHGEEKDIKDAYKIWSVD